MTLEASDSPEDASPSRHSSVDFRLLFESSPVPYLVLRPDDPVFTIAAVNDKYLSATMTRRENILGLGLFEVFPDNPDESEPTGVRNLHASLKRVLHTGKADIMALQRYDVRRSEEQGGGFDERFWSPVNTPVFESTGRLACIIHRVEDLTEFVRLREKGNQQENITRDLSLRLDQIEAELFLRAQQLQQSNVQLREANIELGLLRDRESDRARAAIEKK